MRSSGFDPSASNALLESVARAEVRHDQWDCLCMRWSVRGLLGGVGAVGQIVIVRSGVGELCGQRLLNMKFWPLSGLQEAMPRLIDAITE